jgi:hypothetical protein
MKAQFPGWCPAGQDEIDEGDEIERDADDRWVHVRCMGMVDGGPPDFEAREKLKPRCLLCADLVDEQTGVCGNCG